MFLHQDCHAIDFETCKQFRVLLCERHETTCSHRLIRMDWVGFDSTQLGAMSEMTTMGINNQKAYSVCGFFFQVKLVLFSLVLSDSLKNLRM